MKVSGSFIEKVILRQIEEETGESRLIVAIIVQAIEDFDVDFLRSSDCKRYAELIGINLTFIKEIGATYIAHNMANNPKLLADWLGNTLSCPINTIKNLENSLPA